MNFDLSATVEEEMPPLISLGEKNYEKFISFNSGRYRAQTYGLKETQLQLPTKMRGHIRFFRKDSRRDKSCVFLRVLLDYKLHCKV